jgi:hypothetical protein
VTRFQKAKPARRYFDHSRNPNVHLFSLDLHQWNMQTQISRLGTIPACSRLPSRVPQLHHQLRSRIPVEEIDCIVHSLQALTSMCLTVWQRAKLGLS